MIENRLMLNKKKVYELPDEVVVEKYERRTKGGRTPKFTPDICITSFGSLNIKKPQETAVQIWVKTDNRNLIEFISEYDFESKLNKVTNAYNMELWRFKKIILEEFYGAKDDRK